MSKEKRRTSTEFGCYRVTIEDPIVSGPGQEWDREWAVPHSQGTMCNVSLTHRAPYAMYGQHFFGHGREMLACEGNRQTRDLDS